VTRLGLDFALAIGLSLAMGFVLGLLFGRAGPR
jgi:hypothetical protein